MLKPFLLFVLSISPIISQAHVLNKPDHLPVDGDCLTLQKYELLPIGEPGTNIVWDFSDASICDGNYKIRYRVNNDHIYIYQNQTRFNYIPYYPTQK